MKLALVVQRYGADIGGGSELHARYVAEGLSAHAEVRVLTTCARDYLTWRNEFRPGLDEVNGVPVERFPVARERDLAAFARLSSLVFDSPHSRHDEWTWLESQGPVCPDLVRRVERSEREFDFIVAFSLRYYTAMHAVRSASARTMLVPTLERDPALGLSIVASALAHAGAIMYNSPEERALIEAIAGTSTVPGVTVGIGSRVPTSPSADRALRAQQLERPFIVYVGRVDANKGCEELFDYFQRYCDHTTRRVDLVLIGRATLPVPQHPRIRHLGYLSDTDKFDVIAGAEALVMPSPFESLSMAALEAWALGRPVIANGRCDVLVGQCIRSNGGLYYRNGREFEAMLDTVLDNPALASQMGNLGRAFYYREYDWPVVERKYLAMFETMKQNQTAQPQRGFDRASWLESRRRRLPAAATVVAKAPSGPVRDQTPHGD